MGGQRHAPAALTPGKDPVPIVQEAGRAPGPVWKGAESLTPIGIRSPDRPARSESLYGLSRPGPQIQEVVSHKYVCLRASLSQIIALHASYFMEPG